GRDLLRRLQARIAAIESGDIAELALIGTPAGILDAAEKIALELGKFIGRNWKAGHVETFDRLEHHLLPRTRTIAGETRDQLVCRIAQFADVKIVKRWIVVGTRAHRWSADRDR